PLLVADLLADQERRYAERGRHDESDREQIELGQKTKPNRGCAQRRQRIAAEPCRGAKLHDGIAADTGTRAIFICCAGGGRRIAYAGDCRFMRSRRESRRFSAAILVARSDAPTFPWSRLRR